METCVGRCAVCSAHHPTQGSPVVAVRRGSPEGFVNSNPPAHLSKSVLAVSAFHTVVTTFYQRDSVWGPVLGRTVLWCVCLQDLLVSRDYHTQHREHQGRTEYWVNSGLFPSITENRSLFLNFIWPRSGLSGTSESWTSRLRFGCVRLRVPLTE